MSSIQGGDSNRFGFGVEGTSATGMTSEALVRWQRLADVGVALVVTGDGPVELALDVLRSLLDRLTRPHRLLEQLDADVDGVLAGDTLAAGRLRDRLGILASSCPELIGSRARAQVIVEASGPDHHMDRVDEHRDESTVSFDLLVCLGTAAAMATIDYPEAALDAALDVVLGLAMLTSAADQLVKGLASGGPPGAAEALNTLRLLGHWAAVTPALMQTMSGGLGGIPGGGLGGIPGGGLGGIPGGPRDPDEIIGFVHEVVDRLRDRRRWDPEIWDTVVPWREIVGLPPVEVIDRDEIRRYGCLIALIQALKLRQEPPPPRPALVVWSDAITGLTPNSGCAGDRIVITGIRFGAPDVDVGVLLPMADGCQAFAVPAADWTPTAITVTLPVGIASGPVGLVDLGYVRAYDEWAMRMNELTKSIIENAKCSRSKAPDVAYVPLFRTCAPLTPVNHLRAGLPVIWSFKANGADVAFVEPGQPLRLEWDLRNVDHFRLTRLSNTGPQFAGASFIDDPSGTLYDLGPFTGNRPVEATYELRANGPCGGVASVVKVQLRKVPVLEIEGIEVTQAIQTFRDPTSPPNAIPLVAHKDTIVRVYVAVENLGSYGPHGVAGEVTVSGKVTLVGPSFPTNLPPLNFLASTRVRPRAKIDRTQADHTLNFRIPAAMASSNAYTAFIVDVWATDEVEAPPTGVKTRPTAHTSRPIAWVEKTPYKVRYVRISHGSGGALTDAAAREAIVRGFDLLPTIPTDLAPARVATWHTSVDIDTSDGIHDLLGHIDDQHDCTFSEWLFPWEDECPDDDGAVWVGILPRSGNPAGSAQGYQFTNINRNTVIVGPSQDVIAHELGHTLKLNHVNPQLNCGMAPDEDGAFDTLPDGGAIRFGDAFDPFRVSVKWPVYDFMTYACEKWVSRDTWMRLFGKF
jgi:hypothetical protein